MKVLIPGKASDSNRSCAHVCSFHNCEFWLNGKKISSKRRKAKAKKILGVYRCDYVNYTGTVDLRKRMDHPITDFPDSSKN